MARRTRRSRKPTDGLASRPTPRSQTLLAAARALPASGEPDVPALRALAARDRSFAGVLSGRLDFLRSFGQTFNGLRSIPTALGYADALGITDYRQRYERGGIAERIIEAYPFATWAGGARIVEDADPETETPFETSVREVFDRLDVWSILTRADILACLGHFSLILIGAGGDIQTALDPANNTIYYLKPVAEDHCLIVDYDKDPNSPRFGRPTFYNITIDNGATAEPALVRVHFSRVIHVAEGLLENNLYGKPRLRAPWNYLDDLDKVIGGGSEAAWKRMDPGMQVDIDPEIEMGEDEEELLSAELDDYQNNLRRLIRTRGTKINPLATQVQPFGPNADAIVKLISATTGIPYRILTGSERGELASTQDRFNWSDRINERRRGYATPLVRQMVQRFIEVGVVTPPAGFTPNPDSPDSLQRIPTASSSTNSIPQQTFPGGYDIVWPEVGDVSNQAKADIVNKMAAANAAMANANLPPVLLPDEIRHLVFGLGPLDAKEIQKWAEIIAKAKAQAAVETQKAVAESGLMPPPQKTGGATDSTPSGGPPNADKPGRGNNTPGAPSKGAAAGT